jgi:multiple sugar transport system substrate-binding protein
MRRRSLALAAVVIAFAVAGSGGESRAANDPVTLVISNNQWLDALRGEVLWNALLKYEKVAPDVKLKQEAIPTPAYEDKLITEFGAGQGPDIAIVQDALFYALAGAGFLVPVDQAVAGVDTLNNTNDDGVVDGKRLGIAWQRAVYALIYNKGLVESVGVKVPTDVDGLIASTKVVTKATGAYGFSARHQMSEVSNWYKDFQNWAYGYGVNWVNKDGKLTIDTPEAAAAVAAFKKVYDSGIIPIGDDMKTQRSRFKENRCAFGLDNSGTALNLVSGGALKSADLAAAPLPFDHPGAHQQFFIAVSKHSEHQKAAMDFLAWLVSPDGQQALRDASGSDALATDVPVTQEFLTANPWAKTFAELAAHSRSALIPGYEVKTAEIMRVVMEAVERVLVANADPKTSLAEAQREIDAKF